MKTKQKTIDSLSRKEKKYNKRLGNKQVRKRGKLDNQLPRR
jgi:hypothetical protein